MGNGASKQEYFSKSRLEKAYTLPAGSDIERLFYEGFDTDAQEIQSSSATPITPHPDRSLGTSRKDSKWIPVQPPIQIKGKTLPPPLPVTPAPTLVAREDVLSPRSALRRAASDPGRVAKGPASDDSGTPPDSTYSTGDERWKQRTRRRITDRVTGQESMSMLSHTQLLSEMKLNDDEIDEASRAGQDERN